MRHIAFISVLAVLTFISGCSSSRQPPKSVLVRFRNASGHELTNVRIRFPGNAELRKDKLGPNKVSEYTVVPGAYRYGSFACTVNGDRQSAMATDYVGESPLPPGRYTYVLSDDGTSGKVSLRLEQDP